MVTFIDNLVKMSFGSIKAKWFVTKRGKIFCQVRHLLGGGKDETAVRRFCLDGSVFREYKAIDDAEELTIGQVRYRIRKGLVK